MKRFLTSLLPVLVIVSIAVLGAGSTAGAQPTCPAGSVLVSNQCEIEGDVPIRGTASCPVGPNIVQAGCYEVFQPVSGVCPANSDAVNGECRRAVALIPGELVCTQSGYQLVGERCVRYVDPTCGSAGCQRKITVTYTVECVGTGLSRVNLGTPKLENGAIANFITVNGSAVIGADLRAGTAVKVVVTPERSDTTVAVTGPSVAPDCGAAEPTATTVPPTATPPPATAVPPAATSVAPAPTTAPPPPPTAEPTATTAAEPDPAPEPTPVATVESEPEPTEESEPAIPLFCPQGQALVDTRCVLPCSEVAAGTECFDVTGATTTRQPDPPAAAATSDGVGDGDDDSGSDLPILPLAIVGAATVILAPVAYVTANEIGQKR